MHVWMLAFLLMGGHYWNGDTTERAITAKINKILQPDMLLEDAERRLKVSGKSKLRLEVRKATQTYISEAYAGVAIEIESQPDNANVWHLVHWKVRPRRKKEVFAPITDSAYDVAKLLRVGMSWREAIEKLEIWAESLPLIAAWKGVYWCRSRRHPKELIVLTVDFKDHKGYITKWEVETDPKKGMPPGPITSADIQRM